MGRAGISYVEVEKACNQLVADNENVTVDNIREITGAGSKSTLLKFKKQWELAASQSQTQPEGELLLVNDEKADERILSLVNELKDLALEEAKLICARKDEDTEKTILAEKKINDELSRRYESLEEKHNILKNTQDKLQSAYDENDKLLKIAIKESAEAQQLVIQKDEKIVLLEGQIDSLEKKHKHARESLEHFRQAMQDQRDQDQIKWEQMQNEYQTHIKNLEDKLSDKSSKVSDLDQANGRLAEQNKNLNKLIVEKEHLLSEATTKTHQLETALHESSSREIGQQRKITELTVSQVKLEQAEKDKHDLAERLSESDLRYQKQIDNYQKILEDQNKRIMDLETIIKKQETNALLKKKKAKKKPDNV